MLWQLITSRHTPPHASTPCERRSPSSLLELRTDAELTLRRIDKAMRTTRCHWCGSGLYPDIPRLCPACGAIHTETRYERQRPEGVPLNSALTKVTS
jgi:hypothetical protein